MNRWKKHIAIALLCMFSVNSVGYELPAGTIHCATMQQISPLFDVVLPRDIGTVVAQYHGTSNDYVVCIKDVHCNPEVQRNVYAILCALKQQYGAALRSVCREGGFGRIDMRVVRAIPTMYRIRDRVIASLTEKGLFTGTEHYAADESKIVLRGIDDERVYKKNRDALLDALQCGNAATAALGLLRKQLEHKEKKLGVHSRRVRAIAQKYQEGKIGIEPYCMLLTQWAHAHGIRVEQQFPQLNTLCAAARLRTQMPSLEIVRVEAMFAEKQLQQWLSNEERTRLTHSKQDPCTYYRVVWDIAKHHIPLTQYAALAQYCLYRALCDSIDPVRVMNEAQKLQYGLEEHLAATNKEHNTIHIQHTLILLENYCNNTASRADVSCVDTQMQRMMQRLQTFADTYQTDTAWYAQWMRVMPKLCAQLNAMKQFYAYASQRDAVLVQNTLHARDTERIHVMVVGGYHTDGIQTLLRAQGISHIVIAPHVARVYDRTRYAQLLTHQAHISHTPLVPQSLALMSLLQTPDARERIAQEVFAAIKEARLTYDEAKYFFETMGTVLRENGGAVECSVGKKHVHIADTQMRLDELVGVRSLFDKVKFDSAYRCMPIDTAVILEGAELLMGEEDVFVHGMRTLLDMPLMRNVQWYLAIPKGTLIRPTHEMQMWVEDRSEEPIRFHATTKMIALLAYVYAHPREILERLSAQEAAFLQRAYPYDTDFRTSGFALLVDQKCRYLTSTVQRHRERLDEIAAHARTACEPFLLGPFLSLSTYLEDRVNTLFCGPRGIIAEHVTVDAVIDMMTRLSRVLSAANVENLLVASDNAAVNALTAIGLMGGEIRQQLADAVYALCDQPSSTCAIAANVLFYVYDPRWKPIVQEWRTRLSGGTDNARRDTIDMLNTVGVCLAGNPEDEESEDELREIITAIRLQLHSDPTSVRHAATNAMRDITRGVVAQLNRFRDIHIMDVLTHELIERISDENTEILFAAKDGLVAITSGIIKYVADEAMQRCVLQVLNRIIDSVMPIPEQPKHPLAQSVVGTLSCLCRDLVPYLDVPGTRDMMERTIRRLITWLRIPYVQSAVATVLSKIVLVPPAESDEITRNYCSTLLERVQRAMDDHREVQTRIREGMPEMEEEEYKQLQCVLFCVLQEKIDCTVMERTLFGEIIARVIVPLIHTMNRSPTLTEENLTSVAAIAHAA